MDGTKGSPEINLYTHGQLTFNKGGKNAQGGKDSSSASGAGKIRQSHINQ